MLVLTVLYVLYLCMHVGIQVLNVCLKASTHAVVVASTAPFYRSGFIELYIECNVL